MPNPTPYEAGPAVEETRVEPTPPERIYLQWENGTEFDWSWAAERINDEDWEYALCRRPSSPPDEPSVAREGFEKALREMEKSWNLAGGWEVPDANEARWNKAIADVRRLYDDAASRSPAPPIAVTDEDVERARQEWQRAESEIQWSPLHARLRRLLEDYASRQAVHRAEFTEADVQNVREAAASIENRAWYDYPGQTPTEIHRRNPELESARDFRDLANRIAASLKGVPAINDDLELEAAIHEYGEAVLSRNDAKIPVARERIRAAARQGAK